VPCDVAILVHVDARHPERLATPREISVNDSGSTQPAATSRQRDAMIQFLANIFRGLSFVFGITAPPPNRDQRPFVYMWLGILGFLILFFAGLFYALWYVHLL
jgi:hypothetical protein